MRPYRAHDETDTLILEAADDAFDRFGYQKTTIADIARSCDMSAANVYRFYANKAAIGDALTAKTLIEIEAHLQTIAEREAPAAQRLGALLVDLVFLHQGLFERSRKTLDLFEIAIAEQWGSMVAYIGKAQAMVTGLIEVGTEDGEFDTIAGPDETAGTIMSALEGLIVPKQFGLPGAPNTEVQAEVVISLLVRGLIRS